MKHTKLLVVALLVALMACLCINAMADTCSGDYHVGTIKKVDKDGNLFDATTDTYLVKPTCYQEGLIRYNCSACGNFWNVPVAKTKHSFPDTYNYQKAPTCTEEGYNARKCTVAGCGAIEESSKIILPKVDHQWVTMANVKAPTCETPGCTAIQRCKVCDLRRGGEPIPAIGHNLNGAIWRALVAPTCANEGLIGRFCQYDATWTAAENPDYAGQPKCNKGGKTHDADGADKKYAIETMTVAKTDHAAADKVVIVKATAPTCEKAGCSAQWSCKKCGATGGGEYVKPLGHDLTAAAWRVLKAPTCAEEGLIGRFCQRSEKWTAAENPAYDGQTKCDKGGKTKDVEPGDKKYAIETKSVAKLTGDKNHKKADGSDAWTLIIPAKPQTCEETGCTEMYQCSVCGATKGGDVKPALGHKWGPWIEDNKASCEKDGQRHRQCQNGALCAKAWAETGEAHIQVEKVPAYGHRATWYAGTGTPSASNPVLYTLKCDICGTTLATQLVYSAADAPKGTVTTAVGVQASTASGKVKTASNPAVAKNSATKTGETAAKSTAKTTSTKSTASTASTKTAAAAPAAAAAAPAAKKVATVAAVMAAPAVELEPNQAQLVADKHLYVVRNVAGEEIVLTVNIVDGKITVEAKLAEGESLVLYANAEAIENPTAENTLVLTANEAVELPEAFLNEAIVAVVKTESLPTALAAK